jgi:hypothetical protein
MLADAFPIEFPAPEPTEKSISLNRPAFQAIRAYQRENEPRLSNTHTLAIYRDWYAKAAGQVVRIAALLALADSREQIGEQDIIHGKDIVEWSSAHMQRAYGITVGADIKLAQRAIAWLRKKGWQTINRPQITRGLRISPNDAEQVVRTLIDHGYLREVFTPSKETEYEINYACPTTKEDEY